MYNPLEKEKKKAKLASKSKVISGLRLALRVFQRKDFSLAGEKFEGKLMGTAGKEHF